MRAILPQAKMLLDAGVFYPSAAVVDGWAASNTFHAENKPVLARIVRPWIEANDMLLARTNESLGIVHDKHYPNVPLRDVASL